MFDLEEYEREVVAMPLYDDICYGIITEAGEVVDVIKKGSRPGKEIDLAHLEEEIGDEIWYLTRLANKYGLSLQGILEWNLIKLRKRHNND